jgi:trehalose/maltose hydrolase-like predicted phosphorylase
MGNASGGVHIASLGGLWQAVVFGFAGLSLTEEGLAFAPHCPVSWHAVRFPLLWRGQRLRVQIEPASLEMELVEGTSVPVAVGGAAAIRLEAGSKSRWVLTEGSWKEATHEHQ